MSPLDTAFGIIKHLKTDRGTEYLPQLKFSNPHIFATWSRKSSYLAARSEGLKYQAAKFWRLEK